MSGNRGVRQGGRLSASTTPRRVALAALAVLIATAGVADETAADAPDSVTMNAEIDYLLAAVAGSDCVFIRNGREHDAREARDHLQMKRRRGRRHYDDTDEFIEKIASRSSLSRKPYRIRCGDVEETAATWFGAQLRRYRNSNP